MTTRRPLRLMRSFGRVFLEIALFSLLFAVGVPARAQNRTPVTHQVRSSAAALLTVDADGKLSAATYRNPPSPICSTTTSTAANVDTDCEALTTGSHSETSIAVNPLNSLNLVGTANDVQNWSGTGEPAGTYYSTVFPRAHVSFDGGQTWTTYPIDYSNYTAVSDPAVSFDARGTVYLSTIGYVFSQGPAVFCCTNPDVLVSHSGDGGKTWSRPERIAAGTGTFSSPGIFNDKPYLAAWGNGNAIVTWTLYNQGQKGSFISSPIFSSVTHDGGSTWSKPTEISGSASFCAGAQGGDFCDQDQFSVPAVAADGNIYVSFINTSDLITGRDQYLVIKVDPSSGQRVAGPFKVAGVVDGFTDYPMNVDAYPTYQDSEFRTTAIGNIAADPTNPNHLALGWSDMRNSALPSPLDPYQAKTNCDIIISQSYDGGVTWSTPTAILAPGDQFMPWVAYDASGTLRIGYFDRSYDAANHKYGYTLATEQSPGSLTFDLKQLTTQLSDPTTGARWRARNVNPSFPDAPNYIGDYSGISAVGTGVAALWTDMRLIACFQGRCGSTLDAFYASSR